MKTLFKILIVLLFPLSLVNATTVDNCLTCHQDFEEEGDPSHKFARDIHFQKGISCSDCHGGDPTLEDMDEVYESDSYLGIPDHFEVPEFCARCHSDASYMHEHNPSLPVDQLAKYKTSTHGQRLFGEKDPKVANCISCHTVHEIGDGKLPHSSTHPLNIPATCGKCHADAEYMSGYSIATNQLDDYKKSVHGIALLENKDLGAPACNDCHGNHGAAPPGVNSLAAVCGVCHALEAELFNSSPHKDAYEENDFPMCETCHSNHMILKPSDRMIGSLCIECHEPDDGTIGISTADSIVASLKSLVKAANDARIVLDDAKVKGMMTIDEEFNMKEVDQSLIQARTLVHSFNIDSVSPKVKEGIDKAKVVQANSAQLVDEYFFRRKGLGVATLIITFLVIMLYRKIRHIEK